MPGRLSKGRLTARKVTATLSLLGVLLLLSMLLSALVGSESVDFDRVFIQSGTDRDIFLGYRLPRVLMAALVYLWRQGALDWGTRTKSCPCTYTRKSDHR